jgi:hypothetical protein
MTADFITCRFDPCEDGYLYLDKKRLVLFTAEERDAYVAAYEKARSPVLGVAVPILIVAGAVLGTVFFDLRLSGWMVAAAVFGSEALVTSPSRQVHARLVKDAAARPAIDRELSDTEIQARQTKMISWSFLFTVLCTLGWMLFNSLTHPGALNWIMATFAAFMGLVFLSLAFRKAFPARRVAARTPLNL